MIIEHIIFQLLASEPTAEQRYRTEALEVLNHRSSQVDTPDKKRNHTKTPSADLLQNDQTCFGLAQLYLWGKSDVLRGRLTLAPSKQDMDRGIYWLIEAAKKEAPQAQDFLLSVFNIENNYTSEKLYDPTFPDQLKIALQRKLQALKKSANVALQKKEAHTTPPSNDSTYVDLSANSRTTSEATAETPE